jgi:hypothetical protein
MTIPIAFVLGLASAFYVYVAFHWGREAMLARRGRIRSSSIMVLSTTAPGGSMPAMELEDNAKSSASAETREGWKGGHDVIAIRRPKAQKQENQVVV